LDQEMVREEPDQDFVSSSGGVRTGSAQRLPRGMVRQTSKMNTGYPLISGLIE
jgi:hypothetical protein